MNGTTETTQGVMSLWKLSAAFRASGKASWRRRLTNGAGCASVGGARCEGGCGKLPS